VKRFMTIAFCLTLTGCLTVNAALPGTLRGDVEPTDVEKVGSFNYETGNWFFLWGLVGSPSEDIFSKEIRQQVLSKGADGVQNLAVESKTGCFDLLIGGVTCGLIAPRSYVVKGDLVRIKKPPLPGVPPAAGPAAKPVQTAMAH
jgi:hypothetical protein